MTVRHSPLLLCVLLLVMALGTSSCGPERTFTGVWQQVQCGENETREDCDGYLYELHVGRYGDAVSGVLVRYRHEETAFDGFRAAAECGCFLIDSGRAEDDGLEFRLFHPESPRTRTRDGASTASCTPESECPGRRFSLKESANGLVGEATCDGASPVPIRFVASLGSPRTQCFSTEAPQ